MEILAVLFFLFNLFVILPLQVYAFVRGINVQRYNLGIAKGRRYKQGFWWRQAVALARSRKAAGANFVVTAVLAAIGLVLAFSINAWLQVGLCSYILVNALVAASFFATQLPTIDAESAAASSDNAVSTPEATP